MSSIAKLSADLMYDNIVSQENGNQIAFFSSEEIANKVNETINSSFSHLFKSERLLAGEFSPACVIQRLADVDLSSIFHSLKTKSYQQASESDRKRDDNDDLFESLTDPIASRTSSVDSLSISSASEDEEPPTSGK